MWFRRTAPSASRAASANIAAGPDLAAEFGRGVPAPARIVEHAARERDHVGLAGGDDLLGLPRFGDQADRDGGHAGRLLDRLARTAPDSRARAESSAAATRRRRTHRSSRRRASSVPWRIRWSARDPSRPRPSRSPTPYAHRLVGRKRGAHRVEHFERKPHPVLQASRHIGRCAGWRSATGTGAADSRARRAARARRCPAARRASPRRRTRRGCASVPPHRARAVAASPSLCGSAEGASVCQPPSASGISWPPSHGRGSIPCGRHGPVASRPRSSNACGPPRGPASAPPRWRRSTARGSPA